MKPRISQLAKTTRGKQTALALRARQDYRVATLGIIFDVHCFLDMQSALSLYYVSYSIYHWLKVPKLLPYFLFRFSFTFHA